MALQGFVRPKDIKVRDRLIISVSGLGKNGKTHFALNSEYPLVSFSSDMGEEGVVGKFADKDIQIMHLARFSDGDMSAGAPQEEFNRFRTAYLRALRDPKIKTIVWDTATEIWELLRLARFGKLTQVMPYQYGPVNAEYRSLIREAQYGDKNLILLHQMRPVYIKDKRTDEYERAGFSDTEYLVQVVTRISYDPDEQEFTLTIDGCRHNPHLTKTELSGPMCTFEMLKSMVLG